MTKQLANTEDERSALELLEAALDQPSEQRSAFLETHGAYSPSARMRARALLDFASQDSGNFITGKASQDFREFEKLPDTIGAYRVLRLIGRGGMGNVYLAERASGDFDHVVAIKVIKSGLLSDEIKQRFLRERQLLASLNHPHIAQLFDGGEVDDGSPFIVMEFVDGQPLDAWLEKAKPSKAQALDVFGQICEAVGFAHQNLVIHRDLTPANILINSNIKAKLIDFGIARSEGGAEGGQTSTTGYTPGFAAPERKGGEAANVLSDIFSLGKLLELMSRGFQDAELNAIAAKATATDPAQRYSAVGALTEDLRAYRAGKPVNAFSTSPAYVMRKFAGRQKVLVTSFACVAILLITGFVAISSAYRSAEAARQETEAAFADTRRLANTMMFDVYDEVQKVPGGTKAQMRLAETAQSYLDKLSSRPNLAQDVRIDVGLGYMRLARVTGSTRGNTLGDLATGSQLYERSLAVLKEAYARAPEDSKTRMAYGQALVEAAGHALFSKADIETGTSSAQRGQEILESVPIEELTAAAASTIGRAYYFQAEATAWGGNYEDGIRLCEEGLAKLEALASDVRADLAVQRAEGTLYSSKSIHLMAAGRTQEGFAAMEETIEKRARLVEASGEAPADIRTLTISHHTLAQAYLSQNRPLDAKEHTGAALELSRLGMRRDSEDIGPKDLFAATAVLSAMVAAREGLVSEANRLLDETIKTSVELRDLNPDIVAGPLRYAIRMQEVSQVYSAMGAQAKACMIGAEAAAIMQQQNDLGNLPPTNLQGNLKPLLAALSDC